MISPGFQDQKKIVFTTFEDSDPIKHRKRKTELFPNQRIHSLTPVLGQKIQTLKQIKIKIDVKMPSIRKENREIPYFNALSNKKKTSFTPKHLPKKGSIQYYSPKKTEFKLKVNNQLEKKPQILLEFKSRQLSTENCTNKNVYSQLLAFLIKVQVEFVPIYQAIDIHRKGKIEFEDFEVFVRKNNFGIEPWDCFQKLLQLNSYFSRENFVLKRNFLALCAGLQYKRPTEKDYNGIFLTLSQDILMLSIEKYARAFSELTDRNCIEIVKILALKSFKDEKSYKSLQTVFSEPVDLQRFIHCYPFFKWLYH
jgi:hypothetical protein